MNKSDWIEGFKYALAVRTMIKPSIHQRIAEEWYDMSSDKPAKGDKVECVLLHQREDIWVEFEVEAPLSTQFTVCDGEGRTFFYFYTDKGDTWRPVS